MWFFLLFGLGIVLEIIMAFARKPIFAYRPIVHASIVAGFLSFTALLVACRCMHLKHETAIVRAMVLVPLAFVIFLFGLFPDFVHHWNKL